ncbi:Tachykinin-like peptides receptor 86C [Holothuria leucospilota]|uniref:Tachykinin-like peptides receptor 86C n=1 Tax=Holothuria leucospilota TaxID=206669 RepID=A0A9Q0YM57_HOLLE|nr:Tachykinin-like peptides receptor 86C [Holothuria leucospilota]
MFLTIIGNGIVIIIIMVNKHMRTTTYFYLLNLAVADITIAVFNEWLWLIQNLTNNWIFGAFMCKFSSFIIGVSVQVSILTLTVVAGDRCFAIVYPLQSRVVKSSRALVIFAIFLVWAVAIALNVPIILYTRYVSFLWHDGVHQILSLQHWCTEDREENKTILTFYTTFLFILTYVIPLVIMLIAYILIAKTLNSRGAGLECTTTAQDKSKRKVGFYTFYTLLMFLSDADGGRGAFGLQPPF